MLSYFNQLISTLPDEQKKSEPAGEVEDSSKPPLNIMEDYYYAFGRKGEWSYESWNSYLSMLARNNPQWFSIFQQFSQSQGIDWKFMYEHWRSNQPKSEANTYNDAFSKPPTNISSKPVAKKSTQAENEDCIYCYDCEIGFENLRKYMKHLRGLTHMQKALEKTTLEDNPSVFEDAGPLDSAQLQSVQHYLEDQSEQVEENTTFCEVCGVECGSVLYYMFHQNGDKHRDRLKQLGSEVSQSPVQPKLRIQPRIEVSEEALVGLDHLTEYQTIYFCDLCERLHRNQEKAFSHLYGKSHRRNYLKRYYPHLFKFISIDKSHKKIKLERIEAYARFVAEEEQMDSSQIKLKTFTTFSDLYQQPELKKPLEHQALVDKDGEEKEEMLPIAWSDSRKRKSCSPCRELSPFRNPTMEESSDPTTEDAFLDELTAKFKETKETKEPEPVVEKQPQKVDPLPSLLTNPMQTVNQLLSKASLQKPEEGEVVSDTEIIMDQDPAEIFDAYSLVSKENPRASSNGQPKPVKMASSTKKHVRQSKLSAYADLLGINEPPPPVDHYAPPPPMHHQHESVYCTPSNKNDNLLSLAQSLANLSQMINKPNAAPAMIPITALQPQLLFTNPAFLVNPFLQTTQSNTQ
ncbi:hypothetical protein Ciccas_005132 [Cichlidogyrus casuarinus]|uniref:Matrin-type domain-containing protein n=1 Tax=Cichlidogyrus casuarinus TaxID=1844966 RepID=A0ABD2QBT7_9PLAT